MAASKKFKLTINDINKVDLNNLLKNLNPSGEVSINIMLPDTKETYKTLSQQTDIDWDFKEEVCEERESSLVDFVLDQTNCTTFNEVSTIIEAVRRVSFDCSGFDEGMWRETFTKRFLEVSGEKPTLEHLTMAMLAESYYEGSTDFKTVLSDLLGKIETKWSMFPNFTMTSVIAKTLFSK